MRGSSVTAARSCLQPLVSASRYLAVQALSGDPFYFIVDVKSKVKEVYAQTCTLLGQQGMQDCELFGLAILSDGEYLFVDQECKLNKYAPKNWRSSHTYGLDSSGRPAFVLYFRVRYYVDTPLLLSDETTRHHYYLQLRDNVVRHGGGVESWQGRHPLQSGSVYGPLLSLAGLALQADLGDYNDERHRRQTAYCKPSDYLPAHMCHEENALSVLAAQHRDNRGLSREEAELSYIREALLLEAPLNAHLYRLRRSKSEQGPGRALLAICAGGVRIYGDDDSPQVFTWNNIGKLGFDRKKFEIRAVDQPGKLTLFSGCDDKSKLLLALCRDTHQFFMAIAPRVTEAKRREEEERKVLRDCYMYPARCKLSLASTRGSRADQRISLISSTSSNTTSGIVSDRVHSEDEPDGIGGVSASEESSSADLALGLPQTTSNGSILQQDLGSPISSVLPTTTNSTMVTTTRQALGSQCSSNCSTVVHTATAAAAASGANALVNGMEMQDTNESVRRTSVGSSLELGYSHTAQNSAVSSDAAYDRCGVKAAKYGGTDVGSETSGVYTLHSSEMLDDQLANDSSVQSTTDEASVTSGFYTIHSGLDGSSTQDSIYSLCRGGKIPADDDDDEDNNEDNVNTRENIDNENAVGVSAPCTNEVRSIVTPSSCGQVTTPDLDFTVNDRTLTNEDQSNLGINIEDGMVAHRSRSNSILSTGSFRGDGSDPSNGQGPLLSADELSDLIVGRYPPRKSVGASMDSNCDYVRMPPPPAPPPRTDSCPQTLPPPPPYPGHAQLPPPPSYPRERFEIPPPTPPRNDAITPREPPPPPPPPARVQPPTYPGDKMKPLPVHAPVAALVVGPNNYLDVHATRTGPVLLPYLSPPQQAQQQQRQPPPPPPPPSHTSSPSCATVYTSQLARSQIEQYKQQLYSDVDYVMFPLKDPALSQQEYIDAKQGSLMAAMAAQPPPPPYPSLTPTNKSSTMYRSTPYLPLSSYSSNQNLAISGSLSDTNSSNYLLYGGSQYAASTSSLYSGLTCSSGHSSSRRDLNQLYASPPPPPPPLPPTSSLARRYQMQQQQQQQQYHQHQLQQRTRSHENILKSYDAQAMSSSTASLASLSLSRTRDLAKSSGLVTKHRRLPPPPPPPPYDIPDLAASKPLCVDGSGDTIPTRLQQQPVQQSQSQSQTKQHQKQQSSLSTSQQRQQDVMLDIKSLREKSKNLDLPLISALCNDRYLLKQTKAFVMPKHPNDSSANKTNSRSSNGASSSSKHHKQPSSGVSNQLMGKPPRKPSSGAHKHPAGSLSMAKTTASVYQINGSQQLSANDKTNQSRASLS